MNVTPKSSLRLVVDDTEIRPIVAEAARHVFRFRAPSREVRLVSRAIVPAALAINSDLRLLGYAIQGLTIRQGKRAVALPLSDERLIDGFYDFEGGGWRWTNGNAVIPARLCAGFAGEIELTVIGFEVPHYGRFDRAAEADRVLFQTFESLGENCDFGFAQRAYGAEPVGLLRWASTSLAQLESGLKSGFEGLGDPARTELVWSVDSQEYRLRDRGLMSLHTGHRIRTDEPREQAAIKDRACARVSLLRRKLLAEIAEARKIFVFKTDGSTTGEEKFRSLHAALNGLRPSDSCKVGLLCVRQANHGETPGTVREIGDRLVMGMIDRFVGQDGPYDAWRALCEQARDRLRPDEAACSR